MTKNVEFYAAIVAEMESFYETHGYLPHKSAARLIDVAKRLLEETKVKA